MSKTERVLLWSSNLWMFGNGLLGPLFAVFTGSIGGSVLDISTAWAVYTIVTGVLTVIIGRWADKVGYEKLLVFGYALNALLTFAYLFVNTAEMLFLVQAGLGVALAFSNPTWAALYDKHSNDHKDGEIWGAAYGQSNIAVGIAALFGGFIVTNYSFDTLFIIMGIVQIIATIWLFKTFIWK